MDALDVCADAAQSTQSGDSLGRQQPELTIELWIARVALVRRLHSYPDTPVVLDCSAGKELHLPQRIEVHAKPIDRVRRQPGVFRNAVDEDLIGCATELKHRVQLGFADHFNTESGVEPLFGQRRQRMGFVGEPWTKGDRRPHRVEPLQRLSYRLKRGYVARRSDALDRPRHTFFPHEHTVSGATFPPPAQNLLGWHAGDADVRTADTLEPSG